MNELKRKYKVCHFSTVHNVADTRVFHRECIAIHRAGFDVVLIVPNGRDDEIDNIKIKHIPIVRGRLRRFFISTFQVLIACYREKADIYHYHDPELMIAGMILRLSGKKVIIDIHDDVLYFMNNKHYLPISIRKPIGLGVLMLQKFLILFHSGVVTATPFISKRFGKRHVISVQNFPEYSRFERCKQIPYDQRPLKFIFTGVMHEKAGFINYLKTASLFDSDYTIDIVGRFSPQSLVKKLQPYSAIQFKPWMEYDSVLHEIMSSRAGLCLYPSTPQFVESYPRKFFEYMAAGIPVIASDFPLWREIIHKNGAGLLVNPESPEDISDAIKWIATNQTEAKQMGKNGRKLVEEIYCWEKEKEKLIAFYEKLKID